VRRHAKAPSAGPTSSNGRARGRAIAPSLVVVALALLAFAPAAQAGKVVDRIVAGSTATGTTGGLFNGPRGIAVNYANVADGNGTEGWIYVADDNNHRIQAFDASGAFKFAIGRDVIASGKAGDLGTAVLEKCTVAADCKAGSFGTTADGPVGEFDNPQGVAINQQTGHIYVRDRDNRRVQEFEADGDFVRMWGQDVIVATGPPPNSNGTGFEVCDVTNGNVVADCKQGTNGGAGGQFASSSSASTGIAVFPQGAPNAGNVLVADAGNRRIQEFTATGAWVRAWGWDVIVPGGTGEQVGAPLNEQQTVSWSGGGIININGGTFTLTFNSQTTAGIPWNATAAEVDAALEALAAVGAGNVSVSGGPGDSNGASFTVEFTGALGGTNVSELSVSTAGLNTNFGSGLELGAVSTTVPGGPTAAFESCTVAAECKAATESTPAALNGAFATNSPVHLAVDSGGTVYASDTAASGRVLRFDSTQASAPALLRSAIDVAALTGTASSGTAGLDVDPSNGNLLVARSAAIGVLELLDPDGLPAAGERHYEAAGLNPNGIAIDGAGDDLYLSTNHRLFAADDDGAPPATVTIDSPTDLGAHSATLTGTVNPGGPLPVSYRFQTSRNGATWTDVAPPVDLGGGTSPIPVDDSVTGLEANTFYRARLVTQKGFGNPAVTSGEAVFLTDSVGPEVETYYPRARTAAGATLVGSLNPNNLSTTYYFEYGKTTAYGTKAPVPAGTASGGNSRLVLTEIDGLAPDTTYHFRLVATNAEGTSAGADMTFHTRAVGQPQGARAYEMVTPPFKVVRSLASAGEPERENLAPGVPSLSGDVIQWAVGFLPLSDDVEDPLSSDKRLSSRTPAGWVSATQNTQRTIEPDVAWPTLFSDNPSFFAKHNFVASSADLKTVVWDSVAGALLPADGMMENLLYTRREGTGTNGFTPWLTNPAEQIGAQGLATNIGVNKNPWRDQALINDEGTAMVRWGLYRGLADTAGDDSLDPSDDQQLFGNEMAPAQQPFGGTTIYRQAATDPDDLPTAPKELVNGCTGTGGAATAIPSRVGTGSAPTDVIGTQPCEAPTPPVTGSGDLVEGSPTISDVSTGSGTFAVGQLISGRGIPSGARITAVGAGTLTISTAAAPAAVGAGILTSGSRFVSDVSRSSGTFAVGQVIAAAGLPAGTVVQAVKDDGYLFLSEAATASGEQSLRADEPASDTALSADSQHVTNLRGAGVGANSNPRESGVDLVIRALTGTSATAMSNDGKRIFFQSPDIAAPGLPASGCGAGAGIETSCTPQLFVRQYDSAGEAVVRWISHSRGTPVGDNGYSGAIIPGQQVAEMGAGVGFQGASRDGSVVYFKTNAPLTPDDPNGGVSITSGQAQNTSWDLYRYELPALGSDPDEGVLTRVSGGPDGTADPGTNPATVDGLTSPAGAGGALRYLSDDGERAYFVTTAPITGADTTPPIGGATSPAGAVGNRTVRNLYLFDAAETGSERYKFIAQLPFSKNSDTALIPTSINSCASYDSQFAGGEPAAKTNCFRGTRDATTVVFTTGGRLTADDEDNASDIYLYDAEADELLRVAATPTGQSPYLCRPGSGEDGGACSAELSRRDQGSAVFTVPGQWQSIRGWGSARYYNVAEDADGVVSVFFQSRLQLVPEDTNGDYMDVYQWRGGELSLISRGSQPRESWYSGSGLDGRDVFMVTSDRIDPREIDPEDFDIYDARIGGGIPYTPPPEPCKVLALACEIEATSGPVAGSPATSGFVGQGNVKSSSGAPARKCAKGKVRRKGHCVRKKTTRDAKRTAKSDRRAGR